MHLVVSAGDVIRPLQATASGSENGQDKQWRYPEAHPWFITAAAPQGKPRLGGRWHVVQETLSPLKLLRCIHSTLSWSSVICKKASQLWILAQYPVSIYIEITSKEYG